MKTGLWYGLMALLLAGPGQAQDLSGAWQGVETTLPRPGYWPSVLTLKTGIGGTVTGTLYEEDGSDPSFTGLFQLKGSQTGSVVQVNEMNILEQHVIGEGSWCQGAVTFTYDPTTEKLSGQARYRQVGTCNRGTFELYRIKLKSAAEVQSGSLSTLRVSGQNVRWFTDPGLTHPVASGNDYRTKLTKTTTFYLTQGFYTTDKSPIVPITIRATGTAPTSGPEAVTPLSPREVPLMRPIPKTLPTFLAPAAAQPSPASAVLPTVLFRQTTAELLPSSYPALDTLAAELKARPSLRIRVAGHTDRIGKADKNVALSEQRALSVKTYLLKAGIGADRIEIIGYGDAHLLYPSPDARNRRVEIEELK